MNLVKLKWATNDDLRRRVGIIYKITCIVNGKSYIGYSLNSFYDRYGRFWYKHHHNRYLKYAIKKHGSQNFNIEIICENYILQFLELLEIFYIKQYKTNNPKFGYNLTNGGRLSTKWNKNAVSKLTKSRKKSNNWFLQRCYSVHGEKYTYPDLKYKNGLQKVNILCPLHGMFWQTCQYHLSGTGCPDCFKNIAIKNFFNRSNIKHRNKYDYSKFIYKSLRLPGIIICPYHGEFSQTPNAHLNIRGCKKCYEKEKFINRVSKKFHYKYDYSLVEYITNDKNVKIICPKHGIFEQTPMNHLKGYHCASCSPKKFQGINDFVQKALTVHGNCYDYTSSVFNPESRKINIDCPVHGQFFQLYNSHLNGRGCWKCSPRGGSNTNEFIIKACKVHGQIYDYSKSFYVTATKNIIIICLTHGEFLQKPCNHLCGHGCPKCGRQKTVCGVSKVRKGYFNPIYSSKPIIQYDLKGKIVINMFPSASEAARYFSSKGIKINSLSINRVCRNERKSYAGYYWEYIK